MWRWLLDDLTSAPILLGAVFAVAVVLALALAGVRAAVVTVWRFLFRPQR